MGMGGNGMPKVIPALLYCLYINTVSVNYKYFSVTTEAVY